MREKIYAHWSKVTLGIGIVILGVLMGLYHVIELKLWLLWLNLFVYSLHQFEEHSYPGHFKESINTLLSGSEQTPVNDGDIFFVNIFYVWILGPISFLLYPVSYIFPAALLVTILFNVNIHIVAGIRLRKYNPGLIMSVVANLPVALYTLILFVQTMNPGEVVIAVVGGIFIHATVFMYILVKRKRMVVTP